MMKSYFYLIAGLLVLQSVSIQADVATELQTKYAAQAEDNFSVEKGEALWSRNFPDPKSEQERSCATCHTTNLSHMGKHARTGKEIKPMAPSVNPKRLADARKVEKWFKRNCKWTLGRECTPQEKGDLLMFINSQ